MALIVRQLYVHPVKACQGVDVQEAVLLEDGTLELDRKWCIVDSRGDRYSALQSLSQRQCPVLASISVSLDMTSTDAGTLSLDAPGMPTLSIPFSTADTTTTTDKGEEVKVECAGASTTSAGSWHLGVLSGADEGDAASEWLTTHLNTADKAKVDVWEKSRLLKAV